VFAVLLIVVTGITIASLSSASGRSLISQLFPVSQTDNPESPVDGGSIQEVSVSGHVVVSVMRQGNEVYRFEDHNLITNAGKDFISAQIGSTSAASNGANYIALSSDSTAPAATDTSLAGEISGNGLDRAQGTYSHTPGTDTYTVQRAFTATGAVSNIQKTGLFTAPFGGTMMAENTFSSVSLISGDQLTVTWTITIG
ncbi:MAG: hypothetical protein ACRD5H_12535, partial [Nitrososphaerales archaeon]